MPRTRSSHRHPIAPARTGRTRRLVAAAGLAVAVAGAPLLLAGAAAAATPPVGLGTATSFAVLAGAGITNTGPTTITGDVGTHATTTETGFNTVTLLGVDHAGDAITQQAKTHLTTAYNQAAGSGPPVNVADELGGTTLTPGVYSGATLEITGTLTLDTQGDPNAVFIFQSGSTLITASSSSVVVLGGATACNVYWEVPSSATLGTGSTMVGTVMASTSITANTGATIVGRLLASTGAVTLDSNTITRPVCAPLQATTTTAAPATTTPVTAAPTTAAPNGGSGGPSSPSTTAPDSSITSETPPELAFSGSSTRLIVVGGALIVAGAAIVGMSRRRTA